MQAQSNHEPPRPPALKPPPRVYKVCKTLASPTPRVSLSSSTPARPSGLRSDAQDHGRRGSSHGRSNSGYFVYLLVGVHQTYAEAKQAYARLDFAGSLPVTYERNANGMGKCKTWLAVSRPFKRRSSAEAVQRQLGLYTGEGAVRLARGSIK